MSIKALVILFAVSAMLPFASPWTASADELTTGGGYLALPDQPAGDEALTKQSGSTPGTVVDTNSIQQQQQNTLIVPTPMTMSITKTATTATVNESSRASITSTISATVIRSGVQQTP